jgi:CRISPR/Cas system CSM-associated protein Csm5 (group 7 of RAMP superfamily)
VSVSQPKTPSNSFKKSEINFLCTIKSILATPIPEFEPTEFKFAMNRQAAEANWKVLSSHNGDIQKALESQHRSQLGYGSEFHSSSTLEPLFHSRRRF